MNSSIELNSGEIEKLFRAHYEGLGRYAFSILKNQSEAEEIIQHLFTTLWEKRSSLSISDPKPYLYRSVYNLCMNELKKVKNLHQTIEISDTVEYSSSVSANSDLIENELQEQIEIALSKLPEKCGEVFSLSRKSELSYKEISEKLNISIKTVENHMGKALKLMRAELMEYVGEILIILLFIKGW